MQRFTLPLPNRADSILSIHMYSPPAAQLTAQVPRNYRHLREHISRYHSAMLQDFEDGWHALPQSARRKWSAKENFPINPYTTSPEGFYNWSSAFRTMWSRLLEDKQRELSRCRFAWKTYYGQLNAWKFPDIEGEDSMNNLTDTSLMLEGSSSTNVQISAGLRQSLSRRNRIQMLD